MPARSVNIQVPDSFPLFHVGTIKEFESISPTFHKNKVRSSKILFKYRYRFQPDKQAFKKNVRVRIVRSTYHTPNYRCIKNLWSAFCSIILGTRINFMIHFSLIHIASTDRGRCVKTNYKAIMSFSQCDSLSRKSILSN